jgi:hypothetical protein
MLRLAGYVALLACFGCGDDGSGGNEYTIVSVSNRPAVHDVAMLRVTLANSGTMRTDDIPLGTATFPATFSLTAPGRSGDLVISIDALDAQGLLVGRGTATAAVGSANAAVLLDTTDFVVNTEFADDQYPSAYYDTHGFQAGSTSDGSWTVTYRGSCPIEGCNMFARRFDSAGRAKSTLVAAGTAGFPVSTNLTTGITSPAVAGAGTTTIAVWNYRQPSPGAGVGIACRAFDAQGRAMPDELLISADTGTDVVSVAPLSNNNFVVAWVGGSPRTVRGRIVKPDCVGLNLEVTPSTTANPFSPAVAANGNTVLYGWTVSGDAYVRLASITNSLQGVADVLFLPKTATEQIEFVRVAPLGTGFAVLVRWALSAASEGPGRIELYRTSAQGAVLGQAIVVTTTSGSDFGSSEAFGAATRTDGTMLVTWHACQTTGDGQGCGVFARAFRSDGTPLGEEFVVPTTTVGDQSDPSVTALGDAFAVVWKDLSMQAPDVAGSAVRARIVYPGGGSGSGGN